MKIQNTALHFVYSYFIYKDMSFCNVSNQKSYPFTLPVLPYEANALEPFMSANTFSFHHQKHHNAYVVNLNKLLENNSELHKLDLEALILKSANEPSMQGIFNNSAQVWNHTFFWNSMCKNGGGKPSAKLLAKIEADFGSFEAFCEQFKVAATTQFGSGWAWLVQDAAGKLSVVKTSNAQTPITQGLKPLLTCDVWEHAYYIDFQNRRPDFVASFLEKLANWTFAESNLR